MLNVLKQSTTDAEIKPLNVLTLLNGPTQTSEVVKDKKTTYVGRREKVQIKMQYPKITIDGIDYSSSPEIAEVLIAHVEKVWRLSVEPEPIVDMPKPERKLKIIRSK